MEPNPPPHTAAPAARLDRRMLAASWRAWTSNDLERTGPAWLQWVWTLLFSLGLAVVFTLAGVAGWGGDKAWRWEALPQWATWYGKNVVMCLTIASLIHLMFDGTRWLLGGPQRVRALQPWQRSVVFAGVPMLGVVVGWPLGLWLSGSMDLMPKILRSPGTITGTVTLALGISLALHFLFAARTREIQAERRATEAQLRLLQGQIEPHFLFNTLANVQAMMDHDLPKARSMLAAFTDYLRGSLTQLRRDDSVLALELDLAEAYLRLLQGRMEDRLRYSIDADDAARRVPLPPLLLQPLVENAIVHGLEPQLDGGSVQVRARVQGERLVLQVQDDGRGLHAPQRPGQRPGNGVALKNLRERLQARYGERASLQLQATEPGTLATLTLPIEPAPVH